MSWFGKYLKSSIGAKHVMALTGLMLVGFVLIHMIGNLQIFAGQEAINSYAANLKALGPILWIARAGLVVAALLHVGSAIRIVSMNRAARPVRYKLLKPDASTFASRTMVWSGLIVMAFLVFHLLHFTLGGGPLGAQFNLIDSFGRHDVYNMVVLSFQIPVVAISYVFAILLLCLHLSHGVTSVFQTMGLNHPKYNGLFHLAGPAFATLVLIGNCSMPIACLAGLVKATV